MAIGLKAARNVCAEASGHCSARAAWDWLKTLFVLIAGAFLVAAPNSAWALSTACAAINNGQYVNGGRAGGQNPTAMSGTYGYVANVNGTDENYSTSINLTDTFTVGEQITWSYTKTTNVYLHIIQVDSIGNLVPGNSYDRTAASGSGTFTITDPNAYIDIRLDNADMAYSNFIANRTDGKAVVSISCSAAAPVLGVSMTHSGNASQGGSLAYTITPSTTGAATTTATLTASFTLPSGMTYSSATGAGWSCSGTGQTGSCTRSTSIGTGNGPAITLNTNFASNAATPLVPQVQLSGGGASNAPAATNSTVVNQTPTITAVSPTAGATAGGNSVVITGTNFAGTTGAGGVKFGAANATGYTVNSGTQITATAPANSAGTYDVTVTNGGITTATSAADQYTYVSAPTITAVSPTAGTTGGGTTVTITGTGFSAASPTGAVKFGAANATYTINSNTQITATSPANSAGTYDITVATPGGTSATSAADQFTYVAAPTVTSVSPTAGATGGGTTVTITGTGFSAASPTGAVKFGAANATYTINSNTQITATSPANSAGTYDITVASPGGTSATSASDQFTYVAAPTVTSVSPTSGATGGGTTVVITGTRFSAASPTGAVKFGAANATYTINSNTQITATSPANSAGTYDITVATPGGTSATSAADQFTYVAAPAITSISPTSGPATGGTAVVITGTGFSGVSAVTFGGTGATSFTVTSATSITATAPSGTGTVDIRVTNGGGTSTTSAADQFTFIAAPTVTSISPSAGPTSGGTTVTITGTNFSGVSAVTFGATAATSFTVSSATSITATSPSAGAGTVDIRITSGGGTSATSAADQFTYVTAPTVTSISPTAGPASGGTTVTITGTGFSAASPTGAIKFGATNATYTVNSNTQITATSPASAAGTYDITVSTVGGTSTTSAADQYTYAAAPVASSFTATAQPYDASGVTFGLSGHASNSPASYAVGSATTAQGGSASVDSSGLVTYSAPSGYRGNDSFTFTATNPGGTSSPATVTVPVGNPTLSPVLVGGAGTRGIALSGVRIDATGGRAPYSCSPTLASGALPAGTQLNSDCTISGTPAASGSFTFTANVTDSSLGTGPFTQTTGSLSLTISTPTLALSPASGVLPGASVGAGYSQSFTTSSGTAPYSYARTAGVLPAGLTLTGGTLSGTPTATGTFNFTITATDSSAAGSGGPYTTANAYSITVVAGSQTIAFATLPDVSLSASPVTVPAATASSGLTVTYGSATTSICTVSGNQVTLLATGTCTVDADQAGDSNWNAAPRVQQSFTVTAANLSLTSAAPSGTTVGAGYSQTNSAVGGTAPYTYALHAGALVPGTQVNASTGEVSGTPTLAGTFSYQIQATDSQPVSAQGSVVTVTIAKGSQTLAFTSAVPSPVQIGGTYTVAATANSGLAVGYALDASSTGCSLSGATVTFTAAGTCIVNADQPGDANRNAAPRLQQSIGISQTAQTISFTSAAPSPAPVGSTYAPAATASSGLAVSFSIDPASSAVCSLSSGSVSFAAAGTCTINADQAGSASFTAAPRVQQNVTVSQTAQTIGFTSVVPSPASVGSTYAPAATASSGLAVTFAIDPASSGVCSLASGTVSFAAAGTCTINADQAGNATFNPAARVQQSVTVTQTAQTISFTSTAPSAPTTGTTYTPTATASSGMTVSFSIAAGSANVCSLSSGIVSFDAAGTCVINADQAGDASFSAAAQTQQAISVTMPPPPVARSTDQAVSVHAGNDSSISVDLSALVTGEATSIVIDRQPQHGTLVLTSGSGASPLSFMAAVSAAIPATTRAIYTPTPGYSGPDSFTFRAIGPGGTSNVGTVTIQVIAAAPTAAPISISALAGRTVTVDLTGGAVGGPFTGAAIVSTTPADAADVRLIEGGTAQNRTYRLEFKSRTNETRAVTVLYTLSNAGATSAPLSLTVQVEARPDPSQDPEVRGLESAETGAARRTAETQIRNFGSRMEQLHGGRRSKGMGVNMAAGIPTSGYASGREQDPSAYPAQSGRQLRGNRAASPGAPAGEAGAQPGSTTDVADQKASGDPADDGLRARGNVELWANGVVTVGSHDAATGKDRFDINTSGVTVGGDIVLAPGAIVGVGGGFGHDRSDVGKNGSRVVADSWVAGIYGSFRPIDGAFVDVLAGVGGIDFDLTRYVTATDNFAIARRNAAMMLGSIRAGIDRTDGPLRWSTYGGLEASSTKLHAYAEAGPQSFSLAYDARRVSAVTGLLGGRFEYAIQAGRTILTPRGRFEYRYDFERAGVQRVRFSDWLDGPSYLIDADGWARQQVSAELGIGAALPTGWRLGTDVVGNFSGNSRSVGVKLEVSRGF